MTYARAIDYAVHYARDVAALLRANEALAKALRDYGQHHLSCPQSTLKPWKDKRQDCTCGLDAALAGAETGAEGGECGGALPMCEDCPPAGYPTDKTRCDECPRKATK